MTAVAPHQWIHDGSEVLVLRYCAHDGASSHDFRYPLEVGAVVEAPDWNPADQCGGGLHGWPWGFSIGSGSEPAYGALWQVYACAPEDVVAITESGGGKCKFRRGTLRFSGTWYAALEFIDAGRDAWIAQASEGKDRATGLSGAASATGESGAASATGESGAASATGWRGAASATGESGAASATGESGAASATGWSGAASATGLSGAASATGLSGAASATGGSSAAVVTGPNGRAKAGLFGCIALAWWNPEAKRSEMRCALTGCEGGLKPDTWYALNETGEFVESEKGGA